LSRGGVVVTNEEIMDMRESFKKLESEKENLSLQVRGETVY